MQNYYIFYIYCHVNTNTYNNNYLASLLNNFWDSVFLDADAYNIKCERKRQKKKKRKIKFVYILYYI